MFAQLVVSLWFVVATLAAPTEEAKGQIWAVLVAGSNTFDNYRHQADVCHAYQIFHRHGIPDSNIIVMMYDDIAHNAENPKKGVIINKPNGPNVYGPKKVPKDYTGDDVTPQNFVNVLTGNKSAMIGKGSGKVLKSGPNDHVFINFVDHGATGIIGFPNDVMYASELIKALKTMHKKKMYKKLVFYMEACESGSMFDKILPPNINIFATTAANPEESSYACYYDATIGAYLGDEYSISWMEDIDSEEHQKNMTSETLLKQYKNVVKRVQESHPSMYGQKALDKNKVIDYMGMSNKSFVDTNIMSGPFKDAVSSRDVALRTLERKIELTNDVEKVKTLSLKRDNLIKGRKSVDNLFSQMMEKLNRADAIEEIRHPLNLEMMPCYKTVVDHFRSNCIDITKNTYALAHLYKFANLCVEKTSPDDVIKVISEVCTEQHKSMLGIN
ncbi:legumain-like [Macrosteles quadrilineatus]|uniref:legumain-like n=1 Tax=Macrosteles quadrilineatus TaxID=74068 RepID=UPI0023E0EFDD|nr:legumain-like [Macrosteles quadrilineatus]